MSRTAANSRKTRRAMAIAAHPDDIEFLMAGTLVLLGKAGYELHYMNLSSGNCGSMKSGSHATRVIRRQESIAAAKILGATCHHAIGDDLEIFYDLKTLRKLVSIIRAVAPDIILTHSPQDYMEDHTNTSRLVVTAAFARGIPNFRATPRSRPVANEVVIYHAMPHGLRDQLRQPITPELFVDSTPVQEQKRRALAAHASQKEWLDATQGMDSYLAEMDAMSRQVGVMSGVFEHAEGWRRHLHLGFSAKDQDVLSEVLRTSVRQNPRYNSRTEE